MSAPEVTLRLLAALGLLAAAAWCGYLGARRLTPPGAWAARATATVVVTAYLLAVVFRALGAAHLFRLPAALAIWAALAAIATWFLGDGAGPDLGDELRAARAALADAASPVTRVLLAVGGLCVGARLLRGLMAPPLAYDSLLYHLFKPAQWVQAGGLVHEAAPDWWPFLHAYPIGAEILWAWALLPLHGDGLVALAGGLVWTAVVVAGAATARALGARRDAALLAGAAIGFLPAVVAYLTAGYADTTLLLFLLAAALGLRRAGEGRRGDVLLAAAALGLLASVKHTGLMLGGVGGALLAMTVLRAPISAAERLRRLLAAAVVAAIVAAPDYLHNLREHGSALYPLGGRNAELAALFSGAILPRHLVRFDLGAFFSELWWGPRGLGWLFPLVLVLSVVGGVRVLSRRASIATTLFLLATLALVLVLFSPGYLALRTFWLYSASRFVVPFAATLIVVGAAGAGRAAPMVLQAVVLAALVFAVPRGWGAADARATAVGLVLAVTAGATLALGFWLGRRWRGWRRPALLIGLAALLAIAGLGPRWAAVRDEARAGVYAQAIDGAVFDVHPSRLVGAPLWAHVDDDTPHVIAATAGWNGVGHNWARYPLLGARLQNRVVYVPPTDDGAVIDTRLAASLTAAANPTRWLERLRAAGVDLVVDMGGHPIEADWMDAHPESFQPVADGARGGGHVYRVREAAR